MRPYIFVCLFIFTLALSACGERSNPTDPGVKSEVCTGCASSGACSGHGGVNCAAGPQPNGRVICNDGWKGSKVMYRCGI